jgi:integrase
VAFPNDKHEKQLDVKQWEYVNMSSSRRNNGEGSFLWMRKQNLWRGRTWVRLDDGKLKRKQVYGSTKTEAKEKMQELQRMSKLGLLSVFSKATLGEYLANWWDGADLKPSSLRIRKVNVDRITPIIGGVHLKDLQAAHIIQLEKRLRSDISLRTGKPLSAAARKQAWAILKKALTDAVISGLIEIHPFTRVPKDLSPRIEKTAERILSIEERAKLYTFEPDDLTPLWKLLIMLGMRSGEACALRWQDINFENKTMRINNTIQRVTGPVQYILGTPKTEASRRTIHLQDLHIQILRAVEDDQLLTALGNHDLWHTRVASSGNMAQAPWSKRNPEGFIFIRELGSPILPDYARYRFTKKLITAAIPHARVHDLRHCYAHDQIKMGTSILQVSRNMGHSSVSTTLNIYGHISPETEDRAGQVSVLLYEQAMKLGLEN